MSKIVVIGGGTGLSIILRGLKHVTDNITAVVSVADDGGSSGVLREDIGMLPPGDIRACISSLANTRPIVEKLLSYRFSSGLLEGQSLGNLMIAALKDITGSMEEAVLITSDIFNLKGRVLPVTLEEIHLKGTLENGRVVIGESKLPLESLKSCVRIEKVDLHPRRPQASKQVIDAILEADAVVVAPGSLFTSILPVLLVKGVSEAMKKTKAQKIFVSNLMTQPGETDGFSLGDHVRKIVEHLGENIFDYVLANSKILGEDERKKYNITHSYQINLEKEDLDYFDSLGIRTIDDDFTEVVKGYIRHDYESLAEVVREIIEGEIVKI